MTRHDPTRTNRARGMWAPSPFTGANVLAALQALTSTATTGATARELAAAVRAHVQTNRLDVTHNDLIAVRRILRELVQQQRAVSCGRDLPRTGRSPERWRCVSLGAFSADGSEKRPPSTIPSDVPHV